MTLEGYVTMPNVKPIITNFTAGYQDLVEYLKDKMIAALYPLFNIFFYFKASAFPAYYISLNRVWGINLLVFFF